MIDILLLSYIIYLIKNGGLSTKEYAANPGHDPECRHPDYYVVTMMPDGPRGDIWEECNRCGKQGHFDEARDRHVTPEEWKKDFSYSFGMTRCPTCGRYAWKTVNERSEGNTITYEKECELCGQPATCEQINFRL
jgi:hypothetical protein